LKAFDSAQAEGGLHAEQSRRMNLTISKGGGIVAIFIFLIALAKNLSIYCHRERHREAISRFFGNEKIASLHL